MILLRILVFFLGMVSKRLLFCESVVDEYSSLFWWMVNFELFIGGVLVIIGDEWLDFIFIIRLDVDKNFMGCGYKRSFSWFLI